MKKSNNEKKYKKEHIRRIVKMLWKLELYQLAESERAIESFCEEIKKCDI